MSGIKLTPAERKLLARLQADADNMMLETQVIGSGWSKALNGLLLKALVDMVPHPSVKDGKAPAAAVILTEAGRGVRP